MFRKGFGFSILQTIGIGSACGLVIDEFRKRLFDYLKGELSVFKTAPIFCLALLCAGGFLGQQVAAWRYEGVIQIKDSTIVDLKSKIDAPASRPTAQQRDPDGIYQLGQQVGSVIEPRIDKSTRTVSFASITGAIIFNAASDFEYRDYLLDVKKIQAQSRSMISGEWRRSIDFVTCEIIGRTKAR